MTTSKMAMILTALALGACGDTSVATDSGTVADSGSVPDSGTAIDSGTVIDSGSAIDSGSVIDSGTPPDAGPGATLRTVAALDPAMYEFPEGLALHGGLAYVGLAPSSTVITVTSTGTRAAFGSIPSAGGTDGFMTGLAVDAAGNVYAALARVNPAAATVVPGVYRIPAAGGMGVLWASSPVMEFTNGLDFDASGNLYVTESNGHIFRIPPAGAIGTAEVWSADAMLAPAPPMGPCGMRGTPFGIGANGIVVEADQVVVTHTENASVMRIPIRADGTAGTPVVVAQSCTMLGGADGLGQEAAGRWLAVMQGTMGLARITTDGTVTVLHVGAPLRGPASIDYGDFGGTTQAVITSSSFGDLFSGMLATAMPSVDAATF